MAPKPFPFPIGVGVDICRIDRIAAILREENTRNRWARRVFTRLEWPALIGRFQRANRFEGESYKQWKEDLESREAAEEKKNFPWMLPKLTKQSSILDNEDQTAYWSAIADERSALGRLARHLAGRWAAKEAAIKAHKNRQLYMQDISIISLPHQHAHTKSIDALIDPVCDTVQIHERVATMRMLRGFGPRNSGLPKGPLISNGRVDQMAEEDQAGELQAGMHVNRRRQVTESDRRIAKVNISHDSEYAVAVCMAFDSPNFPKERKLIVDYGNGVLIHEPQWGDEEWLIGETLWEGEEWRNLSLDDLVDPPPRSTDIDTNEGSPKGETEDDDGDDYLRRPPLP